MPWHADGGALLKLMKDVEIWKAMSKCAVAPVSSSGSGLKRDGGGARRRQGVHDSRGDEAPLLEAVEVLPLLDEGPRRPTWRLEEIRQQCLTASTLTGIDEQGSIWAQRAQIWALFFKKNDFGCRLGIADTKNDLFFVS
jgi:hypothetical protein